MENAIVVKDLVYSYRDEIKALKGVSLNVPKGKYVTIIGHNGSGKSTLAKLIAGLLLKESGEIYIDNILYTEETNEQIRPKIGIVFQNPDNQFIGSTVRDDIVFGLENSNVPQEKMDSIINEFAEKVSMSEFLDKEPSNLSGGQKQRVAIAGVLAMNPSILIFDEATSMLDPKGKSEIKALIQKLHHESDRTILSITHDIEESLMSDYVIVLNDGKVILEGEPFEVFKNEKILKDIKLDIPFTIYVRNEFKKVGIELPITNDLDEIVEALCQLR